LANFQIFGKIFNEMSTFDKRKMAFWQQNPLELSNDQGAPYCLPTHFLYT